MPPDAQRRYADNERDLYGLLEDHRYRPAKRSGKAWIRGLRVTVYDVLDYLAGGMTDEQILDDFPDLTEEDIRACLAYAADAERRLEIVPL